MMHRGLIARIQYARSGDRALVVVVVVVVVVVDCGSTGKSQALKITKNLINKSEELLTLFVRKQSQFLH